MPLEVKWSIYIAYIASVLCFKLKDTWNTLVLFFNVRIAMCNNMMGYKQIFNHHVLFIKIASKFSSF